MNAEKAVAELNELGFHYTLTEAASTSPARAPRKTASGRYKAPTERPALPYLPFQNDPSSRWANAPVTKDQEAVHVEELMERHLAKVG